MASARRPRLALRVALALILAASGWIAWRYGRSETARRAERVTISLRVNLGRRSEITTSTPLLFEVSLTGGADDADVRIGGLKRPRLSLVRLVRAGSDEGLTWPVSPLGAPTAIRVARGARGPDIRVERSNTAVVEHGRINRLVLGVSPEAMASAPAGTYQIQALLEQGFWPPWRWHGRLTSAAVTVVVRPAAPGGDNERLQRERLTLSARYYLLAKRPDDAYRAAVDLAGREPRDPAAAMLLGDTLAALGRTRSALNAYRAALALSPNAYEEPALLYDRIAKLSRQGAVTSASGR